jgi:hypothetical protein
MHVALVPLATIAWVTLAMTTALVAGNASAQGTQAPSPAPFSAAEPGTQLPKGWIPLTFGGSKDPTQYRFITEDGKTVLHAHAEAAASGLLYPMTSDIRTAPMLQWRWKVSALIPDADNRVASKEDSPARITLGFDGDKSKLTFREKTASAIARTGTGRELPYAEIVYIWSNKAAVGTIIPNPHTKRVQMIVAISGEERVGQWVTLARNVYDDYKRVFGEEPGPLTDVGVLTDTDNTGATVDAWYGDIRFMPATP